MEPKNDNIKSMIVERFITLKGFVFKANNIKAYAKANFKLGIFLRKIKLFSDLKEEYILKQENLKQQILFSLLPAFSTDCLPIFHMYHNDKEIAKTSRLNKNKIEIIFDSCTLYLEEIREDKFFGIELKDTNNKLLALIKKDKMRYGKKNIYEIINYCSDDISDEFILLLTAFSDVTFFAEDNILSWGLVEYRIK